MNYKKILLAITVAFAANVASAASISSNADPLLAGGVVQTFESAVSGKYSSITLGSVAYSVEPGAQLTIGSDYAGMFNNFGSKSLYNTYSGDAFGSLTLTFAKPVTAFGFNWGAADTVWTLTAYDTNNNALGAFALPATQASNNGEFFGLGGFGSDIAKATISGSRGDYVFVDNLTIAAVPEPETYALMLFGMSLIGFVARRSKRNA